MRFCPRCAMRAQGPLPRLAPTIGVSRGPQHRRMNEQYLSGIHSLVAGSHRTRFYATRWTGTTKAVTVASTACQFCWSRMWGWPMVVVLSKPPLAVPQEAPKRAFSLWRRANARRMAVATDSSGIRHPNGICSQWEDAIPAAGGNLRNTSRPAPVCINGDKRNPAFAPALHTWRGHASST